MPLEAPPQPPSLAGGRHVKAMAFLEPGSLLLVAAPPAGEAAAADQLYEYNIERLPEGCEIKEVRALSKILGKVYNSMPFSNASWLNAWIFYQLRILSVTNIEGSINIDPSIFVTNASLYQLMSLYFTIAIVKKT